jgi:micrococcal nuclease
VPPRRQPAWIALAVVVSVCFLAGCNSRLHATSTPRSDVTSVTRVIDGDTIVANIQGTSERVRLIGVDTPETVDPHRPTGCYGPEASAFTKSLLPAGTPIRLVLDAEPRDKYKRLLAYVYRTQDNLFVNDVLARQGYANVLTIPPNVSHVDEFVAAVADARANNRGLWKACPDAKVGD